MIIDELLLSSEEHHSESRSLEVSTMRRDWTSRALAWLSFTILTPTALYAHHNQTQQFDQARERVVTGIVERFAWQNPHAYIYLTSREGNEPRSW
jgi:hypothetical protein